MDVNDEERIYRKLRRIKRNMTKNGATHSETKKIRRKIREFKERKR